MASRSIGADKTIMGRHNTSLILYVVLAALVILVVYFYWTYSSEAKDLKANKKTLEYHLNRNEEDITKLKNQITQLSDQLQQLSKASHDIEVEKEKLNNELTEAKASLVKFITIIIIIIDNAKKFFVTLNND
jgi:peptidoglycan hydrolase CwlO-like protein